MEAPKANYGPKTKSLNSKASIPYDLLTVHPFYFVWFEVIYQEHIITWNFSFGALESPSNCEHDNKNRDKCKLAQISTIYCGHI